MHLGFTVQAADISIHALREEGDAGGFRSDHPSRGFLSTPSARRATSVSVTWSTSQGFLSTPSARRATRRSPLIPAPREISIHALREEGDCRPHLRPAGGIYFYPRPPRGGRLPYLCLFVKSFLFLSTPSARRATWFSRFLRTRQRYFYPRPPRGGRR